MADKITRWNLHQYSISTQMEYRKARRVEAQEIAAKSTQLANSFASISSNRAVAEGDLVSKIVLQRMTQKISKTA